ncbi:50S ribosomal protein L18 [Candidatus Saccharibacteria bacterium]|nr:50S ribosomal protein L18 [Candidatus Saccharibacteria bacterium]
MTAKVRKYKNQRAKRRARVRGRVVGTAKKPRLSVFRSSKHMFAQLVDDERGKTLVSASDLGIGEATKAESAFEVGRELAKRALKKKIKKVVFDRGGYAYHGRVKRVAEGAREGGLEF